MHFWKLVKWGSRPPKLRAKCSVIIRIQQLHLPFHTFVFYNELLRKKSYYWIWMLFPKRFTEIILSLRTDRSGKTMQTQIRLFLRVYTVCHFYILDTLLCAKTLIFRITTATFLGVQIFQIIMVPLNCSLPFRGQVSFASLCFLFFFFSFSCLFFSLIIQNKGNMSRLMTKPTKWLCAQRRLRAAWASAQSDQNLRCPHIESLGP